MGKLMANSFRVLEFDRLFVFSSEMLFILGTDGVIFNMNAAARKRLELEKDQLAGWRLSDPAKGNISLWTRYPPLHQLYPRSGEIVTVQLTAFILPEDWGGQTEMRIVAQELGSLPDELGEAVIPAVDLMTREKGLL